MGHFKIKAKNKLSDMKIDDILSESDFATLTPTGEFVQLEYIEDDEKLEPYNVKPGIWAIQKSGPNLKLIPTTFVNDKILDSFMNVQEITDKIDCFFKNIPIYK